MGAYDQPPRGLKGQTLRRWRASVSPRPKSSHWMAKIQAPRANQKWKTAWAPLTCHSIHHYLHQNQIPFLRSWPRQTLRARTHALAHRENLGLAHQETNRCLLANRLPWVGVEARVHSIEVVRSTLACTGPTEQDGSR